MRENLNIKIFVSHHKPGYIYEDDIFVPIHVGKKNATIDLGILGDDTGDNISHKNPTYAELTAQYRVRKNYDLSNVDYVGFCHYRRYFTYCYKPTLKDYFKKGTNFFDFFSNLITTLFIKKIIIRPFSKELLYKNGLEFKKHIINKDIILDSPYFFLSNKKASEFELQNEKIKQYVINFLKKHYKTDYNNYLKEIRLHRKNMCNTFIMKKEFFIEYSERLFNILFNLEHNISSKKFDLFYGYRDQRFYGMLSERLLNAYIYKKEKEHAKISKNANLLFFK